MSDTPEELMTGLITYLRSAVGRPENEVMDEIAAVFLKFAQSMRETYGQPKYDRKPAPYMHTPEY